MNNEVFVSLLIFIAILLLRMEVQRKNSKLRKWIMKSASWRIERLKKKQKYGKIAKRYRRLARINRRKHLKENLLGLACLYEHDSKSAVEYFGSALNGAVGANINSIKSNLSIAYLQNRWYRRALSLLEEQRKEGHVPIIPYTLALLINGRDDEAEKFYGNHPLKSVDADDLKKLFGFSPFKPETLDSIKELSSGGNLWLYKPVIKDLIYKWEIDIFYNSKNRYEILEKQAKNLLLEFDRHPGLFNSPGVRYMRSIISMILPRINSYNGCSSLWGLVENFDGFVESLHIEEQLKNECLIFWRRVYRIISKTSTIEFYDPDKERNLIKEQIPSDAKNMVRGTSRCGLYVSESIGYALRTLQINHDGFPYYYVDLIEKSFANEIIEDIMPVIELMLEEPSTKEVLEPLLYALVYDRESVTRAEIIDVFNKIPPSTHDKLEKLYKRIV